MPPNTTSTPETTSRRGRRRHLYSGYWQNWVTVVAGMGIFVPWGKNKREEPEEVEGIKPKRMRRPPLASPDVAEVVVVQPVTPTAPVPAPVHPLQQVPSLPRMESFDVFKPGSLECLLQKCRTSSFNSISHLMERPSFRSLSSLSFHEDSYFNDTDAAAMQE